LSGGGSFAVAADARYESKRLSSYNAYGEVPANTRTDLRFSYMSRSNWSVEAFADNVADEVVVVGVGPSINQIPGLYSTSVRPPRTYGVRMSLHF
jgi:outer membrane receptor protein involved in Fe transport